MNLPPLDFTTVHSNTTPIDGNGKVVNVQKSLFRPEVEMGIICRGRVRGESVTMPECRW